jgi:ketosteroid isomerase-like protein
MSATEHRACEQEVIRALFEATDRGDVGTVSSYLHDDVVVVLGNLEPIHGGAAYSALYHQVTSSLGGIRHELHDVWRADDDGARWIVRMTVHYTRTDGDTVSLPCCNVFQFTDGLVSEYQVYMDMTPVFA